MVNVLQDIWIINDGGIVMFHHTFDDKMDEQLFGGLLSALNSFAEELSRGGLKYFELGERNYTILKRAGYLFVANAARNVKPKRMSQELHDVCEIFFNLYSEEILNSWNSDVSIFFDFEKQIENSLEKTMSEFKRAFW